MLTSEYIATRGRKYLFGYGHSVSSAMQQATAQSGIPANVTGTASTEGKSEGAQPVNFFIIIVVLAVIVTVIVVYLKKRRIF